jgi:hypothetical protein
MPKNVKETIEQAEQPLFPIVETVNKWFINNKNVTY